MICLRPCLDTITKLGNICRSEVKQFFGPAPEQPLIFIETEGSPYGTLKYYPYKDIIFEVMENDYIASVTLFKS